MIDIVQVKSHMAELIYELQQKAFKPLLHKYEDYDINPAMESVEKIREKIERKNTTAYAFNLDGVFVGWVRVIEVEDLIYKISALCVIPEYQNRGIAQESLKRIEKYYPNAKKWVLDTIFEEKGNCYLYEKLGYVRVGGLNKINEKMTIVCYEKTCGNKKHTKRIRLYIQ